MCYVEVDGEVVAVVVEFALSVEGEVVFSTAGIVSSILVEALWSLTLSTA